MYNDINDGNGNCRRFFLSDLISANSIKTIIDEIIKINYEDSKKDKKYKNFKREPILLYINSFGGSVYDGLALCDILEKSKTPVHTIAIGSVMSMALPIFLCGTKRYIGKYTTLMFHDVAMFTWDKVECVKPELAESERVRDVMCNIIKRKSSVTQKMLNEYLKNKENWYITAEEALKYKLADAYYTEK